MNIQVAFTCWLLEITPQWTLVRIYVVELVLLFFSGEYPESEIAGSYGSSIFTFWGTPTRFSTAFAPIYNPTRRTRGLPFLHTLANAFYLFSFLMITILTVVGWCLIVALMCLSLMMNDAEHLFTFASLFITERCCIKISCYDDGFISLVFLQAKCLQVYNNYNFCMNWPFNLGTHCIPHKYFLS